MYPLVSFLLSFFLLIINLYLLTEVFKFFQGKVFEQKLQYEIDKSDN